MRTCAQRAHRTRSLPTPPRRSSSQHPASPRGTCCALLTLPQSPAPTPTPNTHTHSGNYILLLPLASLSWGRAGAGEEGDRKGWGRGKTVPAFPARHPHPNSATITWCLEWEVGEEARLFGCSESPVVPSFSAVNSGDAALCPGA